MAIFGRREIDNTIYWNGFNLAIDSSGNPFIGFDRIADKQAWVNALQPDVLFSGDLKTDVTLSSSAANYNHMIIYFKYPNSNTPESSVEVYNPNGKYVNLFFGYAGYNSGLYWPTGRDIYINGTSITTRASFCTSDSTTTKRTLTAGTDTSRIRIIRVEAWNDEWWG